MMRILAFSLFMIFCCSFSAIAKTENDSTKSSIIKWNPRIGEYPSFYYEFYLKPDHALELGAGYVSHIYILDGMFGNVYSCNGFSLRANWNSYGKSKKPYSGFFTSPTLLYRFVSVPLKEYDSLGNYENKRALLHVIEPGFRAGTQIIGKHLTFSIYIGLGMRAKYYNYSTLTNPNPPVIVGYRVSGTDSYGFYVDPAVHLGLNVGLVIPHN